MKVIPCICSLLLITTSALAASTPTSPGTLNFDFGPRGNPVQDGFNEVAASVGHVAGPFVYQFKSNPTTFTSGNILLTLSEGRTLESSLEMCARDRGEVKGRGTPDLGDLYRDFITGPSMISVGIEGLFVGTTYEVTLYCLDIQRSQKMQVTDYTNDIQGDRVVIEYQKDQPAGSFEEARKAGTIKVVVPASGKVLLTVQSLSGGSAVINGLTLSIAEPSYR